MQSYTYTQKPVNVVPPSYNSFYNQLPGEVEPSGYPVYNPYNAAPNNATPRSILQTQPQQNELPQHGHYNSNPIRRKSSATYHPYQVNPHHEPTRSPTRSRFHVPGPITVVQNQDQNLDIFDMPAPISPTRLARLANLIKVDPLNRSKNRNVPSDAEVESLSHISHLKPIHRENPTDTHQLVAQGQFKEPKCTEDFHFRHKPIAFRVRNATKAGFKAGDVMSERPPKLEGEDDFVLKDLKEREFRVRIIWPGYKTFEKRVKTYSPQNEQRTRSFIALRLAYILVDFRKHIKENNWQVDPQQELWKLSTGPGDSGLNIEDLIVTQMVHCGGSHWQMELWAPKF